MLLSVSPLDSGQPRSTSLIHEGVKYTGQPTTFFFFFLRVCLRVRWREVLACLYLCVCVYEQCVGIDEMAYNFAAFFFKRP